MPLSLLVEMFTCREVTNSDILGMIKRFTPNADLHHGVETHKTAESKQFWKEIKEGSTIELCCL
ncbi:hypothetical protein Glove_367g25 [Diversispora epigaea]|uniref:Uncharacterized protein n=1 Tax=Diversispora epigaea TaxID=1348612 RepID=A0A397H884_9GLOM|nr:hypothetical protein Glove_367g25 [Diversispora epigaea]